MARFLRSRAPARPPEVIERSCSSKRRYTSEDMARAYGMQYQVQNKVKLWLYNCRICLGWHLTKSNNGHRSAVDTYTKE